MDERKNYIEKVYSNYWINARREIYGFMPYDKAAINLIEEACKKNGSLRLLEVAIGTGEPIASKLVDDGYEVHGIDLSVDLIEECRRLNPTIRCEVDDAENMRYPDGSFELAYCLHSSWYFPNLNCAIAEMMRVVKIDGSVIFDIQNIRNEQIMRFYKRHLFENRNSLGIIYKTFKNLMKLLLRRGIQNWPIVVSETPSDPVSILKQLEEELGAKKVQVMGWDNNCLIELYDPDCKFAEYGRLLFVVNK